MRECIMGFCDRFILTKRIGLKKVEVGKFQRVDELQEFETAVLRLPN